MPTCRHFPACGGCQTLDIAYPAQLLRKHEELSRHFSAWPGLRIDPVLPSPRSEGYRHKVQLPFGFATASVARSAGPTVGCYAAGSHSVVDQDECLVQEPSLSRVAWAVRAWASAHRLPIYNEGKGTGWLRHLLLRRGAGTGEILLGLVANGETIKRFDPRDLLNDLLERCEEAIGAGQEGGELVGIVLSVNTGRGNVVLGGEEITWYGRPWLRENLGPFTLTAGVSTFLQVNPYQVPRLYDLAVAAIPQGAAVLDLYSGVGSIALWASRKAGSVLGIEENPTAVAAATRAAADNKVSNAAFLAADVGEALGNPEHYLDAAGLPPDAIAKAGAIIVDPPRKGLEPAVREALAALRPERLIYVSCFPATLARDAAAFAGAYRLSSVSPADMFPHTRHVESVAVFERA